MKFSTKHALLALLIAMASVSLPGAGGKQPVKGEQYYTQFSFFHDNGHYITTNHRQGTLIPINSQLSFIHLGGNQIQLKLTDSGSRLIILNIRLYSGMTTAEVFNSILGQTKVNLSKYSDLERKNILLGSLATGMSKNSVMLALGPPDSKKTAAAGNSNRLTYWKSSSKNYEVIFLDEQLVDVQPPHHYPEGKVKKNKAQPVRREPFVVRSNRTNVYDGDTIVAVLPKGTRVSMLERSGDYRLIELTIQGTLISGWVEEKYIRAE